MTNSGNSDGLKKYIIKLFDKVKGDNRYRNLLIASSICVLLFAIVFAYKDNSSNEEYKVVTNTVKLKSAALESSGADALSSTLEHKSLSEVADIKDTIDEILKVEVPVFSVFVDGQVLAMFETRKEAQDLLDDVIGPYIADEETEIEDVRFKENVKIVEQFVASSEQMENREYEDILYYITKGTSETKIHKVEKGENYWVIAKKYNIGVDNLVKANPEIKPEKIQIGQEVSLVVPKPLMTVITTEIKEYTEYIGYETEYEDTNVLYKGEYRVKKAGVKGERDVKAEIAKENGIEVGRNILEEDILKEPTTKIVLQGTKDPPPRIGTGVLAKPTSRGVITSPFGTRWGRMHSGIDIGLPTGTAVKAADGGKVIYSGWKGNYGKCVIIDHGENIQTLYAHNSELVVNKGDKVFKGQTIAKSGNTGRSTGPHLHFEVRKNGTPVNPTSYVKY